MNHQHLSKQQQTIHELLKDREIESASINALLYRGSNLGRLNIPFLLSLFTGLPKKLATYSPDQFSYGAMSRLNPLKSNSYFWQKYGFNDRFSANELLYLIKHNKLSPFTITYFPDLDQSVHKNGRVDVKGIEKVDKQLQKVLNHYQSWDEALNNNIWIVLGDNGQAWIDNDRHNALIDLRKLLSSYQIAKLRGGITQKDEVVLCVNERMSFIYSLDTEKVPLDEIASLLQQDQRIDVIANRKGKEVIVTSGLHRGHLHFYPDGELVDEYGQSWSVEGNEEILDLEIAQNKIKYGDYPDALARLYSPFFSHDGEYIITSAKPGHEFIGEGSPTHVGGASHGGLHKQDSLVSMIVCGTDSTPSNLRIVDLKDWLLSLIQ